MRLVLAICFALSVVAGCVSCTSLPERIQGTDRRVAPPAGWVDYCKRNAKTDPACEGYDDE